MSCTSCGQNYALPLHTEQLTALYGAPLSSACARANISGSIPQVVRYPGFTQVAGTPVAGVASPGGFSSYHAFWKGTPGCYNGGNGDGTYGVGVCA